MSICFNPFHPHLFSPPNQFFYKIFKNGQSVQKMYFPAPNISIYLKLIIIQIIKNIIFR